MTEREKKKKLSQLRIIHSSIRTAFSFNQITTWNELFKRIGGTPLIPDKRITYPELKQFLIDREQSFIEREGSSTPANRTIGVDLSNNKDIAIKSIRKVNKDGTKELISVEEIQPEQSKEHQTNYEHNRTTNDKPILQETKRIEEQNQSTNALEPTNGSVRITSEQSLIPVLLKDLQRWDSKYIYINQQHERSIISQVSKEMVREKECNVEVLDKDTLISARHIAPSVGDTYSKENNYGLKESPKCNPKLVRRWYQKKATAQLYDKIVKEKKTGILLLAGTGTGKTFIIADLIRLLEDIKWYENKTFSHIPMLYVTKNTILEQTNRVFKKWYNLRPNVDFDVINIEMLRSTAGQYWVKEEKYLEKGIEKWRWVWKEHLHPAILFLDESQGAKNRGSSQAQITYSYNNLPSEKRCLVCVSATPFMRVIEAQAWAVSTNALIDHHPGFEEGTRLTNETWPLYAQVIAAPDSPHDYSEAAVARLRKDLEEYIVQVKGVVPQFKAKNRVKIIQFATKEQRDFYNSAWDRFLAEKAKVEAAQDAGKDIGGCILAILTKYSMAAEFCHAPDFAEHMHQSWLSGKVGVCFVKFKQTLIEVVEILINKYGYTRDDISLIWGGGQTQLTAKQKARSKIKSLSSKLKELGVDVDELLGDAGLEDVEDRVIKDYPAWLKLGIQSKDERQREIDKLQRGDSKFCIYTLKAGGVGLSVQHTDEFCVDWVRTKKGFNEWKAMIDKLPIKQQPDKGKCRYKESGYAFEEDIPFIFTRPRRTVGCVTYDAISLAQGIGRGPRINSLSDTEQEILCYAGTVECEMGAVYTKKFHCLSALTRQKEDWSSIVFYGSRASEKAKEIIDATRETDEKDDNGLIGEIDE